MNFFIEKEKCFLIVYFLSLNFIYIKILNKKYEKTFLSFQPHLEGDRRSDKVIVLQ